ncbi:hypothetical protein J3Q64DRAFT_1835311 [Phycomyces blakesleeanus]|uniref:Uncharacterized protein n=2 Tax=Phycomyces blakesleeanus TaxID=4837 RepID=A0A162PJD8_PHYB8|nr:hypothetical protein PHYBLDRAFT_145827 [Phycomyces blakesleeanus NRRL 1555(-)]XP_018291559.1 hypothetical protein PHYBLDRAFT_145909 [Phycomyces blakesleeanus NRRL 1555(-)]OAD73437.1 hypothetical protein PHYBLDRAFT_145827 [Phycomyces blakesleeanus NRRL 1555(-)]OAD73519.1 hypothetical protein PHYBLDRAFT_145909 [Phycomyces blakesleeanus NRRL 1555(-)]|eukprot:XP_018291477.1 hypothetical protein PHYBLDRAFT_145827 [Phycomyces blakesleeanus NRRL 1555(-)]
MNTVPHSIHSPWLKHKTQATKTQNPGTEQARDPANRNLQKNTGNLANQTRPANRTTVAQKRPRIKDSGSPTHLRGSQQEPYEQKVQANPTAVQAPPSNVYKRQIPEANRIENQSSTTIGYTHM